MIVRERKGNTYREVPLNAAVRSVLTQWLQERARRFPDTAELALFLTRQGQRFGVRAINLIVHGIGTSANVRFSAHTLRHTCLTNLVRQGTDIVLVAELAGHRRLDTTRRYTLPTAHDRETAMESIILHDE